VCDADDEGRALRTLSALQDFDERAGAEFGEREARQLLRLFLGDGPAVDGAQEVVEEALAGRGVVEHVADEGGLGRLLDEVAEAV